MSAWLIPGVRITELDTGDDRYVIERVAWCRPDDVNKGDPWQRLVTVHFRDHRLISIQDWQYYTDGREFWNNPCFPPQIVQVKENDMGTLKKTTYAGKEIPTPSNLYRALSSVFLVNAQAFGKATVGEQTEAMTKHGTLPVLFIENFVKLKNVRTIRDKLLAGEDVSVELEFNGIVLTADEQAALAAVRPVLSKIAGIAGAYPWLPEATAASLKSAGVVFYEKSVSVNGYSVTNTTSETIWKKASLYWSGGKKPDVFTRAIGGRNRYVTVTDDYIEIGCQKVTRANAEAIARRFGWEPVVFEGE